MPIDWFPLWLSLRVALLATLLAAAVGIPAAYVLANREFKGRETLDAALTLPLVLPPTVLGYYLLVLLGRILAAVVHSGWQTAWRILFAPQGLAPGSSIDRSPVAKRISG